MSAWGNAGNAPGTYAINTRILQPHITTAHFAPHDPRKHASHIQARRVGPMSDGRFSHYGIWNVDVQVGIRGEEFWSMD
jgi:hypothetical protein